ncbi:MAG: acetyl-CoA acetyltransferase, partial [Polaromonas sp.]|nr:acetyl-CoA acetyltransferase [Polaromonas sp.]
MTREVVVVSGVRTAIGTFGGSLKDTPPTELAALVVRESLARAGVEGKDVGHVVFGHVVNTEPRDMYLSRVAAINGGCSEGTPAFNVNRLCGSGLQAIISASQSILLGDADVAIGGGAENMSRGPYASLATRFGARMGDTKMIDMVVGALHDPFHAIHMGVTAENIAAKWGISREEQDALAVQSHNRAQKAVESGYFKEQIVPVMLKSRKGEVAYDTDEHFRPNCTVADMAKLKPVFLKDNGTVTAGNASGINDAAAAVVLMEAGVAEARGLKPLARLVAYAHAGVDP